MPDARTPTIEGERPETRYKPAGSQTENRPDLPTKTATVRRCAALN
jgi:hypothetical protein